MTHPVLKHSKLWNTKHVYFSCSHTALWNTKHVYFSCSHTTLWNTKHVNFSCSHTTLNMCTFHVHIEHCGTLNMCTFHVHTKHCTTILIQFTDIHAQTAVYCSCLTGLNLRFQVSWDVTLWQWASGFWHSFERMGTIHLTTQRHILGDLNCWLGERLPTCFMCWLMIIASASLAFSLGIVL
jgi:hypothetical protein